MAWQHPRFKSHQKLLTEDEKMSEKKTANLGTLKEELKKVWCQEMTTKYLRNWNDSFQAFANGNQK